MLEHLLDRLTDTKNEWSATGREQLLRAFRREDIDLDASERLRLRRTPTASSPSLEAAPTESGIRLAMTRLERSDAEPEEKVGAAKELVESTVKHALAELGEVHDPNDDIPTLAKALHRRMRLDPRSIAPATCPQRHASRCHAT